MFRLLERGKEIDAYTHEPSAESSFWAQAILACTACEAEHVAVYPFNATSLECPYCGSVLALDAEGLVN